MKTKKKIPKPVVRSKKAIQIKRQKIRRNRPLHKKVLLHPITFFLLLCIGVLLVGWTVHTFADSLDVNGTVFAPLPSTPPTITWPLDQTHFNVAPLTITGDCEANSYVKLYRNNTFSGVATCGPSDTSYQITTDLSEGSNDLYTIIFNITDNEGPTAMHTAVWYDKVMDVLIPPPAISPIVLDRILIRTTENDQYRNGSIPDVSPYPTLSGYAPPNSYVVLKIHSEIVTCATYSDGHGYWSCSINERLPEGLHEVFVTATTSDGKVYSLPRFLIRVSNDIRPLYHVAVPTRPFIIIADYRYAVYASGKPSNWSLNLSGGTRPYAVTVSWDDGKMSTIARTDTSPFSIAHTFTLGGSILQTYTVKVSAVDITGAKASVQLQALVRGNGLTTGAISGGKSSLWVRGKQWMWLVWPSYFIVLLMTVSFWLGERQQSLQIITTKHSRSRVRHA